MLPPPSITQDPLWLPPTAPTSPHFPDNPILSNIYTHYAKEKNPPSTFARPYPSPRDRERPGDIQSPQHSTLVPLILSYFRFNAPPPASLAPSSKTLPNSKKRIQPPQLRHRDQAPHCHPIPHLLAHSLKTPATKMGTEPGSSAVDPYLNLGGRACRKKSVYCSSMPLGKKMAGLRRWGRWMTLVWKAQHGGGSRCMLQDGPISRQSSCNVCHLPFACPIDTGLATCCLPLKDCRFF